MEYEKRNEKEKNWKWLEEEKGRRRAENEPPARDLGTLKRVSHQNDAFHLICSKYFFQNYGGIFDGKNYRGYFDGKLTTVQQ